MPDAPDPAAKFGSPPMNATLPLDAPQTPIRVADNGTSVGQSSESESDDDSAKDELPGLDDFVAAPPTLEGSQQLFTQTNTKSTPLSKIFRNHRTQGGNIMERKNMEAELNIGENRGVKIVSLEEAEEFYRDTATGTEIDKYLARSKLYSKAKKCWPKLSKGGPAEADLYDPIVDIASDIRNHFKPASIPAGVTRQIVKSDKRDLLHENGKGKTSPDICEDLGLDTSVQWEIDENGKKSAGTVTVNECDDEKGIAVPVVYDLNMEEPPLVRASLTGRGTVIWHARHRVTGDQVMIKDSWRADGRIPESEYMKRANELSIQGIAEMIGFQDHVYQTKDCRPADFDDEGFLNRIKLRVVMKKYGLSIWYFRSRVQLLQAILAAIIAHSNLFKNKILHRDISMQNIVLGSATSDSPGYLIDLDMAIDISIDRNVTGVGKDERTGMMLYQSYFTLGGEFLTQLKPLGLANPPPHEYLDDLECFFYVICHIMYTFDRPGGWSKELPDALEGWTSGKRFDVARAKAWFLKTLPGQGATIPAWWGSKCEALLEEFGEVLYEIQGKRNLIFADKRLDAKKREDARADLTNNTTQNFARITTAFERAIAGLQEEGLCAEEQVIYQLSPDAAIQCLHFPLSNIITVLPFEYKLPLGDLEPRTSTKRGPMEGDDFEGGSTKRNRQN